VSTGFIWLWIQTGGRKLTNWATVSFSMKHCAAQKIHTLCTTDSLPSSLEGFRWPKKRKQRHCKCDMTHTHPILFVSRVEFIQAILAAATQNSCPRDAVTILQYSHSTTGYNVPFCGLIEGVSSRQRTAGTVLPTAVMTCHAQMYSRTANCCNDMPCSDVQSYCQLL